MGLWGVSLYGGDFAMDLKSAVAAVARLPLADHEIVEALRSTERAAADHPDDPDHTVFWLVLADQLARRGIYHGEVKERALRIIDQGQDLQQLRSLGAAPGDLRKRQAKWRRSRRSWSHRHPRPARPSPSRNPW